MTRLTRRGLLRAGTAAGILAASGLPLQAQMTRGGRLRAALGGAYATDCWDSRTHSGDFMQMAAQGAVFDTLTEVAADGTLVGELAQSWEASSDARTWTFNLRRGVTFHNGKPFCAEDVLASLRMHLAPGTASPARPMVEAITEMRATGPHQVQLVLEAGNADLPYLLSDYHLLIYPAGQIEEAIAKGIGTGLYRVGHFQPGVRFLGQRVESHYKDGKAGWFDAVEFIAMNDAHARHEALASGHVDAINRVDLRNARRLQAVPGVQVQSLSGNRHFAFPMRTDLAPFDNVNLRRALKHGIDRQAIVDKVLMGHGQAASDSPIGPSNPYFAADLEPVPHDPDKAAFYLRKAGLEALSLDLAVSPAAFEGAVDAARLYQSSARSAGIALNVVEQAADDDWTKSRIRKPFTAASWAGRATEDWMFSTAYAEGAPWNDSHWGATESARFQHLLHSARAELDSNLRREFYAEMQTILRDDGGVVIPVFANWVQATSRKLAVPETVGALWGMDNARMAERWAIG